MVAIKQVPKVEEIALDENGRMIRKGVELQTNPFCRRAITKAVEIARESEGSVTAVAMGPLSASQVIREALAVGVDEGYLICDPAMAGSDTLVTARVLERFISVFGPFSLVLLGRFSIDAGTGQVGPQLAELLGVPFAGA
ncbi:MAG: electron transfer flavoprotein subunit beta/FixA family protein, partial [Ferrimicrobium sp.]